MFNKLAQHLERLLQNNNVAIVRELQINVFALLGATAGGLLIEAQNINTYCRLLLKITQKWSNLLKNAQKCTKIVKIAQNWSKMVKKSSKVPVSQGQQINIVGTFRGAASNSQ